MRMLHIKCVCGKMNNILMTSDDQKYNCTLCGKELTEQLGEDPVKDL